MRVILINTSERIGGAAIAANRLMEALKAQGIKAKMLVRNKQTGQSTVVALKPSWRMVWQFVWERVVIWTANRFSRQNLFAVDIANTGNDITSLPEFQQADIVHLHWVNQGMLSLKDIRKILDSGKPVVWTMHDMWPCTGICHYARRCDHYRTACHNCPYLAALLQGMPVTSIPNAINTNLFRPHDKAAARRKLQLPQDMRLMLFGSVKITDKRKGIDYLVKACRLLADQHPELRDRLAVVAFGRNSQQLGSLLPFKVYPLDFVTGDHQLVDIYNAVDLFATPSLEDNLPNTIMEAMACGTPCVGFNVGGIPEMIDHLHNGYVATYRDAGDFANGIYWLLTEPGYDSLCEQAARKAATHYAESVVAKKYIDLYNKL